MNNFVPRLKQFSADTIKSQKLTLPVGIELMDFGMNTFYEMTATSIDDQAKRRGQIGLACFSLRFNT